MKEVEKDKKEKKENKEKKGKKIIILIIIIVLLLIAFLLWWFFRKFDVKVNYNNGLDDTKLEVKYLNNIDESLLNDELKKDGYTFGGFYEVYYLNGKEIETITNDKTKKDTICKEGFKLDDNNTKCIKEEEFDFENTKIKKDTNIEALWFKQGEEPVTEEPKETKTPSVKTKDNATVKLTVSKSCVIGSSGSVTVTAKISGETSNKTLSWNLPKCYKAKKVSNTVYKLTRSGCGNDASTASVTASLKNGSKSTVKFNFEPTLKVTVYNSDKEISLDNGAYRGSYISLKTNTKATFKGSSSTYKTIVSTTSTSAKLNTAVSDTVTVKTSCGQSKSIKVVAIIN